MYALSSLGVSLLGLATLSSAAALTPRDSSCTNGPTSRNCWNNGFDINTDFAKEWPSTGKVVTYELEMTHETLSPDGVPRDMMVFNKQYPGPTIEADWGDIIQVKLTNSLKTNGTSIHWHGMRQLHSNQMDGVNGLTECPMAPGEVRTYTFKAVEYGSSWYHSHHTLQPGEGLVGHIKINGPTSANYDVEGGFISMTDFFHESLFTIFARRLSGPPIADNVLVNGKGQLNGTGSLSTIKLEAGKKNKFTLINVGNNVWFHASFDQHPMTVVAVDFVPVKPFTVQSLAISVGQRYDVIVDANQTPGNYYFRTVLGGGSCDGPNQKTIAGDTRGAIVTYSGYTGGGDPTSQPYNIPSGCADELAGIVPVRVKDVPAPAAAPVFLDLTMDTTQGIFWKVNGVSMKIDWSTPTLQYVQNGTQASLPTSDNGIAVNGDGWAYFLVQNDTPFPHPIHLHGHNFFVIGSGLGSGQGISYNLTNAVARDTQGVAAGGYLVVAFPMDNPGVWLMHCHIPFHMSFGLGLQLLENADQIVKTVGDMSNVQTGCKNWNGYQASAAQPFFTADSGLKKRSIRRL